MRDDAIEVVTNLAGNADEIVPSAADDAVVRALAAAHAQDD